jgi:hypothetical protein
VNITDLPQNTPQQFAETVRNDYGTWGAVIRALDIKLD